MIAATRRGRVVVTRSRQATSPADLGHLVGTTEYYLARKHDFERRHPNARAPDYYAAYGDKYAKRFMNDNLPHMSDAGKKWTQRVFRGLQQRIEDERRRDPNAFDRLEQDPEALRKFAFATHSKAYLESGLAELPLLDLCLIATVPEPGDVYTLDGLAQIFETKCGLHASYAKQLVREINACRGRDAAAHVARVEEVVALARGESQRLGAVGPRMLGYLASMWRWLRGV